MKVATKYVIFEFLVKTDGSPGVSLYSFLQSFVKKQLLSPLNTLVKKTSPRSRSALDQLEASVFPDAAFAPQTLGINLSVVLSKALIYLVLPCLLASLSLAFPTLITLLLIFPRSHQSLLIFLPLCSHFCLSNTSPTVFFFRSMSVLILLHALPQSSTSSRALFLQRY